MGHKLVAVLANVLLDIQIVLGIALVLFGIKPTLSHLLVVAISALFAHYSYSVEKRRGSSFATLAAAWGAVLPVAVLFY